MTLNLSSLAPPSGRHKCIQLPSSTASPSRGADHSTCTTSPVYFPLAIKTLACKGDNSAASVEDELVAVSPVLNVNVALQDTSDFRGLVGEDDWVAKKFNASFQNNMEE